MSISADSGKRGSTDFSLGGEKGRGENGASPAGRLHLTMKRPGSSESVAGGVCKGEGTWGKCRQYLRIVRPFSTQYLQYPAPS